MGRLLAQAAILLEDDPFWEELLNRIGIETLVAALLGGLMAGLIAGAIVGLIVSVWLHAFEERRRDQANADIDRLYDRALYDVRNHRR
jgi:uncharacterized protein (DUF2062 family)